MNGLMMDFPLSLTAIFRRAETLFGPRRVASRQPDRSIAATDYASIAERTRRLIGVLGDLGIRRGDRVATLAWNHAQHLEVYFAAPMSGAVLHTLNLRLHPDELAYIINHAEDRVVIIDGSLWSLWERIAPQVKVDRVIVIGGDTPPGALDYEQVVTSTPPVESLPDLGEETAAAMCYTTGTTGRPKGVLYSHRSLVLHSIMIALPDGLAIGERDVILPVVPMFHANAWGTPYSAVMTGAGLAMPGPHLDPASLLDLMARERVTLGAGVPTIWMGMAQTLESSAEGTYDLSSVDRLAVGGSAAPPALIRAFDRRGITIVHAWGMTEISPVGTVSHVPSDLASAPPEAQFAARAKQGRPLPFVEVRARTGDQLSPWDGETMGELEVRGPWVARSYYGDEGAGHDRFTDDGWFRTGDIVTIDHRGMVLVQDRTKDLIKSGGEWISSVALENALMGHPAVAEAAVVAVAHEKWIERPLAAVVLKPNAKATPEDLIAFLAPDFPRFWLPDAVVFLDALPRTSAGKFKKSALRDQFREYRLPG